ncbi:MAG: tetratricopeptide repeat protein [Chitinispirillaceae bacterium]
MVKPALPFSWNRDWVWGLLLVAATFLAYQPAWNGSPVWDDELHIIPPELRSLNGLAHIWTQPSHKVQYFPLVHTVFWLESHLWGDSTFGYHLLNILLHVFSALLILRILRKLCVRGAWLAAAIFALHPVMVESVAWITELKNCLSGAFFLSAALTYLTYTETGRRRLYLSALGLFILGLLSKTGIAPFPLAMLVAVWWKRGKLSWRRDIVPLLCFFLAGILFGLITVYMERTHIGTRGPEYEFSLIERCLIAGRALWFYLGKVFLPVNLMISYPRWVLSAAVWWQYLFPAAALMAGCILWAMRKAWRAPAAVFFYFTAMLLPYLGFLSLFAFRYSFVADHYQYLAAIGPIVIGVVFADKVVGLVKAKGGVLKPALTVMLLLALGTLSWNQSRMYSDAETLYRTTIRKNPDSWMAHNNLGLLLADKGRTDEAMALYQKALEINPSYAEAYNNVGLLLADKGRTDEAMAHYQKALEINPDYGGAHFNLGLLLAKMGQTDEAMAHYQKALGLNPNHAKTHNNLGLLLANMGRPDDAAAHYRKALEINPNSAETHYNLGLLLANMGRPDEALVHFQKALELNPNLAEAHNDLGVLLAQSGRTDEAMSHFKKALEINPNNGDAQSNLGLLLTKMGRSDEAILHYQKALEINPDAVDVLQNFAFALVQKRQLTYATSVLQKALASAKSVGDGARAKTIAQIITRLHETINFSQEHSNAHAPR